MNNEQTFNGGDVFFHTGKGYRDPNGREWPHGVFKFVIGDNPDPILSIDANGMMYKGNRIEDAGEAHRTVINFFNKNFNVPNHAGVAK